MDQYFYHFSTKPYDVVAQKNCLLEMGFKHSKVMFLQKDKKIFAILHVRTKFVKIIPMMVFFIYSGYTLFAKIKRITSYLSYYLH